MNGTALVGIVKNFRRKDSLPTLVDWLQKYVGTIENSANMFSSGVQDFDVRRENLIDDLSDMEIEFDALFKAEAFTLDNLIDTVAGLFDQLDAAFDTDDIDMLSSMLFDITNHMQNIITTLQNVNDDSKKTTHNKAEKAIHDLYDLPYYNSAIAFNRLAFTLNSIITVLTKPATGREDAVTLRESIRSILSELSAADRVTINNDKRIAKLLLTLYGEEVVGKITVVEIGKVVTIALENEKQQKSKWIQEQSRYLDEKNLSRSLIVDYDDNDLLQ